MRLALAAGRVITAGLLVWMAVIHLHLWDTGYRHIHDIGPLFLANFVMGLVVALAVLGAPRRLLPLAALGASGLAAGTLAGLLVSVNYGLFGFRDTLTAPYAHESILVESLVIVAGLVLSGASVMTARRSRSMAGAAS